MSLEPKKTEGRKKGALGGLGALVAIGILAYVLLRPAEAKPGEAKLIIQAYGDSKSLNLPFTVDSLHRVTPTYLILPKDTKVLINAPQRITLGTETYYYEKHEEEEA